MPIHLADQVVERPTVDLRPLGKLLEHRPLRPQGQLENLRIHRPVALHTAQASRRIVLIGQDFVEELPVQRRQGAPFDVAPSLPDETPHRIEPLFQQLDLRGVAHALVHRAHAGRDLGQELRFLDRWAAHRVRPSPDVVHQVVELVLFKRHRQLRQDDFGILAEHEIDGPPGRHPALQHAEPPLRQLVAMIGPISAVRVLGERREARIQMTDARRARPGSGGAERARGSGIDVRLERNLNPTA
ncbi:MAG: hypothetical protein ABW032_11165 [Burkholderiaceae bacterium]